MAVFAPLELADWLVVVVSLLNLVWLLEMKRVSKTARPELPTSKTV